MELVEFKEVDYQGLYNFMKPIWFETYQSIIPKKQIEYLLDHYFLIENIHNFRTLGYKYYKLVDDGFKGVVVYVEKENEIYLDKLYIPSNERGKGYADFVFKELLKLGKDVTLNVNQSNERACRCYLKNGFIIDEEQIIELEDGMINKDYRMRLKCK
ncbi:MAG: GNAT family N-acetyltransferase [Erysipelotrichales bacterium]|nr:GNAT family N-acetyltransferase [Erysipelotrichales bacterium]